MLWRRWPCCGGGGHVVAAVAMLWRRWLCWGGGGHVGAAVAMLGRRWPCWGGGGHVVAAVAMLWRRWPCYGGGGHVGAAVALLGRRWPCWGGGGHVGAAVALLGRRWPCLGDGGHVGATVAMLGRRWPCWGGGRSLHPSTFLTMWRSDNYMAVPDRRVLQGVTKRCRLSWLTNSALFYDFFMPAAPIHCCKMVSNTNIWVYGCIIKRNKMLAAPRLFRWTSPIEQAEKDAHIFQDGGQIQRKKNIDHHNASRIAIICHLLAPPHFAMVTIFE